MECTAFRIVATIAPFLAAWSIGACAAPIHDAVQQGNVEQVKAILQTRPEAINDRDQYELTPLHAAAMLGRSEIAGLLLALKANPNAATPSGTPLHDAAAAVNLLILHSRLIARGLQPSIEKTLFQLLAGGPPARDGPDVKAIREVLLGAQDSPETVAEKAKIIRLLVGHGADVNARNVFDQTPLHLAAQNESPRLAETLLTFKPRVDAAAKGGATPLHLAVVTGMTHTARLLLSRGASVSIHAGPRSETPLHAAHTAEIAGLLIDYKADINATSNDGWTPLNFAAGRGDEDVVRLLLDRGADARIHDRAGYLPLHTAAEKGRYGVVEFLLDAGSDVNARAARDQRTPLHKAAQLGDLRTIELLIKRGAQVNAVHSYGQSPLHEAVIYAPSATVLMLLANGANPNIADSQRRAIPLHTSVMGWWVTERLQRKGPIPAAYLVPRTDQRATVELLLKFGAQIDARDDELMTPLIWAAAGGMADVVDLLISAGADVNAANQYEMMALHVAVQRRSLPVVEALLKNKANINTVGQHGATPLAIATRLGFSEIAALLRSRGAF